MHIQDIFKKYETTFSFEFFPPKTEKSSQKLYQTMASLGPLNPSFVSVTYGAGGSTRELTHDLVVRLHRETKLDPIPHLTAIGHSKKEIEEILIRYAKEGISNILALAGDPPHGITNYDRSSDDFKHAIDVVRFIKDFNTKGIHPDARGFGIGVAGFPEGHPATPNRLLEMQYLKEKVDAGADYICTQLFFDNRDFLDFKERCDIAGIKVPIIAGIMPITSINGMKKMAELSGGSRFPAPLLRALDRCQDDTEAVKRVGIHWATEQCRDLIDHKVGGIHFYTLNQSDATREIYQGLGIKDSTLGLRAANI